MKRKMSKLAINTDDPQLYEHLTLIIQEFEEAALQSGKRDGILISANSSLGAMDQVLESSSKALSMNRSKKAADTKEATSNTSQSTTALGGTLTVTPTETQSQDDFIPPIPSPPSVTLSVTGFTQNIVDGPGSLVDLSDVEFDEDMQDLTGTGNLQDFLKDCIGCDARLKFDWQLKPIDLMGPISDFVKEINLALDGFEKQMNPFAAAEKLCDILNNTHWLCLPDLMAILMALKLLLKSYLSFQLKINLDWTVVLGPLLKMILDAIASLVQAIAGTLIGPLDCVLGALKSIAEIEKGIAGVLNTGAAVAQRIGERVNQATDLVTGKKVVLNQDTQLEADLLYKDVSTVKGSPGSATVQTFTDAGKTGTFINLEAPTPPSIDVNVRTADQERDPNAEWSFPSGARLNEKVRLPDSLKDPRFNLSHWTTKLILVIQEAKEYILDLVRKIIGSLNSLKGLVSGGLSVQLGNLGLILFVKDMIALVLLIIRLLSSHKGVKDWCTFLEQHPEILEEAMAKTHGKVNVTKSDRALILSQGPQIVGTIQTCAANTNGAQQQLLSQWISELQRGSE